MHFPYACTRWPAAGPFQNAVYRFGPAPEKRLDAAIGAIAYPSADAGPVRFATERIAIAHALGRFHVHEAHALIGQSGEVEGYVRGDMIFDVEENDLAFEEEKVAEEEELAVDLREGG